MQRKIGSKLQTRTKFLHIGTLGPEAITYRANRQTDPSKQPRTANNRMKIMNIASPYPYEDGDKVDAPHAVSVPVAAVRTRLGSRPDDTEAIGPPTGNMGGEEVVSFAVT